MKHFLSIEELNAQSLSRLLDDASTLKATRGTHMKPLAGQTWGLIFNKSSTRTRLSFEVGIHELGGKALFLSVQDLQLGRGEEIKDTARVMRRMLDGLVIRTFNQSDLDEFAHWGEIPVINALTDQEHPCQILADLLTIKEKMGTLKGKKVCFIGDGYSNMSISWMWAAKYLGFDLTIGTPLQYQPPRGFLKQLNASNVKIVESAKEAVEGAHIINTDVWLSMGQEGQSEKESVFQGFQVNSELMKYTSDGAIVLHCLPAYRGKEISEELLEHHADTIFQQAENRLHVQKAVLASLVS